MTITVAIIKRAFLTWEYLSKGVFVQRFYARVAGSNLLEIIFF